MKYVHGRGHRINGAKDISHARVELEFANTDEANHCLDDRGNKEIIFEIPSRVRQCKGVVTGWDMSNPLDELVDAMVSVRDIMSIERLERGLE